MRSGQLAAAAGVNQQTLRYYERRGLLPAPDRSLGGHRDYGADALTTLRVIKAAQRLGFTLGEIAELFKVGSHRGLRPGMKEHVERKLVDVEAKITALQVMRAALRDIVTAGCVDLVECSCAPDCPVPFPALAPEPITATPYPAPGADEIAASARGGPA